MLLQHEDVAREHKVTARPVLEALPADVLGMPACSKYEGADNHAPA